jgi:hypothetical protein
MAEHARVTLQGQTHPVRRRSAPGIRGRFVCAAASARPLAGHPTQVAAVQSRKEWMPVPSDGRGQELTTSEFAWDHQPQCCSSAERLILAAHG